MPVVTLSTFVVVPNPPTLSCTVEKAILESVGARWQGFGQFPKRIVGNVNRSLHGWANYFHYGNSNRAMEKVKTHPEQRLRIHLMKRHQVKNRGIGEGRFPSVKPYRRYALCKRPTAAAWRSAHALA